MEQAAGGGEKCISGNESVSSCLVSGMRFWQLTCLMLWTSRQGACGRSRSAGQGVDLGSCALAEAP